MISILFSMFLMAGDVAAMPSATTNSVTAEAPKKERKICRAPEAQTSSRMRRRMCLTETEWANRDQGKSAEDLKTIGAR